MNLFPPKGGVVTGVRAEHLSVGAPTGTADDMQVASVEYLGADAVLSLRPLGEPAGDAVFVRVPGARRAAAGERVSLSWNPADEHRFDAATGRRIEDGSHHSQPVPHARKG
jgi:ABC-type sugar transport system ATPase subunit